ncbi:MAG: hypothetical protein KJP21_00815 [Bacteroidia bacterium]|nr:hypothetical protein [Bacteroidia bacterium]NNJ55450.1 hypothetical protein [Bacteroidia bacterium]
MSNEKHIKDLKEIRSLMEQSTRFLSLSGLSGVMAGVYSLIGVYFVLNFSPEPLDLEFADNLLHDSFYFIVAIAVMLFATVTGVFLTVRSAKKNDQSLFTKSAFRMLAYIGFPLLVGGIFCMAMYMHGYTLLIAPAMLIFYGLGLINGSKYTLNDVRTLGIVFVSLGTVSLFFLNHGIYFWALGFGVLHIVYGLAMWLRYEKK